MKVFLLKTFKFFAKDERGVTLVEYGLALTMAVGVGAGVLGVLATDLDNKMGEASTELAPQ
ncbi:Flp family type IVb pilin [Aliiruegeria lutimaris]|uniref:Pilus assembly protein Flp/PilA n=1 Tax=Aliiruegeria lutimaris TaxID=571298 RepID=A0A1G9JXR3_9RHOB|nr:hypothetical protein [Aliiruegeria lutimaris]SDL42202.1 hypothetical protein SAMN04488026_108424 [Aliiruegeria lutimaris]